MTTPEPPPPPPFYFVGTSPSEQRGPKGTSGGGWVVRSLAQLVGRLVLLRLITIRVVKVVGVSLSLSVSVSGCSTKTTHTHTHTHAKALEGDTEGRDMNTNRYCNTAVRMQKKSLKVEKHERKRPIHQDGLSVSSSDTQHRASSLFFSTFFGSSTLSSCSSSSSSCLGVREK